MDTDILCMYTVETKNNIDISQDNILIKNVTKEKEKFYSI